MDAQIEKNEEPGFWDRHLREVFRFCGEPARWVRANLFIIWLAVLFLFWTFSPVQGIPYPSEVWAAFLRMFASEANDSSNLVYNTWTTVKLNIVGLFFASVISLIVAYFSILPLLQPFNQIL